MGNPTPVNSQITDAVTQTNVPTTGQSPEQAMGQLIQQEEAAEQQNNTAKQEGGE